MIEKKQLIRGVMVLVCILMIWFIYVSWKQIERNRRIEAEVSTLQKEAEKIRRENETLSEKISYFSSADFREQEAKEKLGMKKTDETVVVIKPRPADEAVPTENQGEKRITSDSGADVPNYKKWWALFFKAI